MENQDGKFFKQFFGLPGLFLLFLVIYLSFYSVKWEPNEHLVNSTDSNNKTIQISMLHYGRGDQVPVRNVGENTFKHFGMGQAAVVIAAFILFIVIQNLKYEAKEMKTIDEHKKFIKQRLQGQEGIKSFHIHENSPLQQIRIDDSVSKPMKRFIFAEVYFDDDQESESGPKIKEYAVDPYKFEILEINELRLIPDNMAKCPNCGKYPDFKVMTPEGLKKLREMYPPRS